MDIHKIHLMQERGLREDSQLPHHFHLNNQWIHPIINNEMNINTFILLLSYFIRYEGNELHLGSR